MIYLDAEGMLEHLNAHKRGRLISRHGVVDGVPYFSFEPAILSQTILHDGMLRSWKPNATPDNCGTYHHLPVAFHA
jgi:hypothetical protein